MASPEREKRLQSCTVLVVTCANFVDTLLAFLTPRARELVVITHIVPHYYKRGPVTTARLYQSGSMRQENTYGKRWGPAYRGMAACIAHLLFAAQCAYTLFEVLRRRRRFDLYIGVQHPFPVVGLLLRRLGIVKKVIYYDQDYFPPGGGLSKRAAGSAFIRFMDRFFLRSSDAVWHLTPILKRLKEAQAPGRRTPAMVVPVGINAAPPAAAPSKTGTGPTIAYVGELTERMALDACIDAVDQVRRAIPDIRLLIIGEGPAEAALRNRVRNLGLKGNVEFLGFIEGQDRVRAILTQCAAGIAPYVTAPWQPARYADPGKVKLYMAAGLPVIVTPAPALAQEIEREGAGIVAECTAEAFADAYARLLGSEEVLQTYKANVVSLARKYHYETVFQQAFDQTLPMLYPRTGVPLPSKDDDSL
jgi:glycosyltransferase involved in cell wall biosynthesis